MLPRVLAPVAALLLVTMTACTQAEQQQPPQPRERDQVEVETADPPQLGACRLLTPDDVAQSSNDSPAVPCSKRHTAQTFAVGTFPGNVADDGPEDDGLGAYVFKTCDKRFKAFTGGDDSLVMRSTLTWAWFRPPDDAWEQGARWYRCDVVGGGQQSKGYVDLPEDSRGLLLGEPADRWMICVNGPTVSGSVKIPCSEEHTWRAVTTIKVGEPGDPYPGDRLVEVRTRDFCSDSVGAWLNYPIDYDFGYTFFHEAEWQAGNRRSICWAKTDQ